MIESMHRRDFLRAAPLTVGMLARSAQAAAVESRLRIEPFDFAEDFPYLMYFDWKAWPYALW